MIRALAFILLLSAFAYAEQRLTIWNTQAVMKNTRGYVVNISSVAVASGGTAGECLGLLCAVTKAN